MLSRCTELNFSKGIGFDTSGISFLMLVHYFGDVNVPLRETLPIHFHLLVFSSMLLECKCWDCIFLKVT